MLRLRPVFLLDSMPTTRPTMTIGSASQFIQPNNGIRPGMAKIRATRPIRIETIFSMHKI